MQRPYDHFFSRTVRGKNMCIQQPQHAREPLIKKEAKVERLRVRETGYQGPGESGQGKTKFHTSVRYRRARSIRSKSVIKK